MRLRAAGAADRARRQQPSLLLSYGRPVVLLLFLLVWYRLVASLYSRGGQSRTAANEAEHAGKHVHASLRQKPWYSRHLLLRDALLKRDAKRVYVLHLGDAERFARLAEERGEAVTIVDGCTDTPQASDLLGASGRGQCRALRGHAHSLVINAYGLPTQPYFDEKALYIALLPQPGTFAPARCPSEKPAGPFSLPQWLQRWGPAKRATRATLLSALAGGQPHAQGAGDGGADARARGAKAEAALDSFDAVFTADEWLPDTPTRLLGLLGWDPETLPPAGWTAADVGLVPEGRAARRGAAAAGAAERAAYEHAGGIARRGMAARAEDALAEPGAPRRARWGLQSCEAVPDGEKSSSWVGEPGQGPGGAPPGAGAAPEFRGWGLPAGRDAGGSCDFASGGGVAACLVLRDGAPYLREWLNFHRAAGVARVYIHNDNSTDDTDKVLTPYEASGFVVRLDCLYGPLRFRVLGRCMTHAILDSACWLLNPDLDEYFVPAQPTADKTIGGVLSAFRDAMCATVRRHAFNSNNASAVDPAATGIIRVFLRRHAPFPPIIMELPRNPKWALNIPYAARELAAGGRHAVVPQIHNLWDRRNCSMCFRGDPEFTPEIHPCAAFYADDKFKGPGPENPRNWCTGPSGASAEDVLKVHHYILPNGKSYRKKGRGDKGARRDIWDNETVDADALVFAHAVDSFWPPT